jgi:hypothetical protein
MLLLTSLIGIIVPILARQIILWVMARVAEAKGLASQEQLAAITAIVDLVVRAAEQSGLAGYLEEMGMTKRDWALEELQRILNERGFSGISVSTLYTLIEDAVRRGAQDLSDLPAEVVYELSE